MTQPIRSRLARYAWSAAAPLSGQICTFLLAPLLLHRLGRDRFGAWVLVQTLVVLLGGSDLGAVGTLNRFLAVHVGRRDTQAITRLVVTSVVFLTALAAVVTAVLLTSSSALAATVDVSSVVRHELVDMAPAVCVLAGIALLNGVLSAVASAHGRFRLLGSVALSTSLLFIVTVIMTIHHPQDLVRLAWLACLQGGATLVILVVATARHLDLGAIGFLTKEEAREVGRFASRVQLAGAAALVNTEVDAVIIAALLPVRDVATYGIGAAVASALRSLPLFVLAPVMTSMAQDFGRSGFESALSSLRVRHKQWLEAVIPYTLIAVACLPFLVPAWVGDGYRESAVVGVVLLAGFGLNLTTAVMTLFVQTIGRADLEARYGWVAVVVNLGLTYPLGRAFGVLGVVAATSVGAVIASLYYYWIVIRGADVPLRVFLPRVRLWRVVPILLLCVLLEAALRALWQGHGVLHAVGAGLVLAVGLALWLIPSVHGWIRNE